MEKPEVKEVVDAVKKLNYNPNDFNWNIKKSSYLEVVLKDEPRLRFMFHTNPQEFNLFKVQYSLYRPDYRMSAVTGWTKTGDAINIFSDWLRDDIRQFFGVRDMPDPIAEFQNEAFAYDLNEDNKYQPFDDDQRLRLKQVINNAKEETLKQFDLNPDVKEYVERQYKYLEEKVDTSNQYDFWAIARRLFYDIGVNVSANVIVTVGSAAMSGLEISPLFVTIVTSAFRLIRHYLSP